MARNAPEVQAQFANLDRDYNIIRRNYEELLARRESVNIAEAARTGSDRVTLEVVDPPTMPTVPTSPKRLLLAVGVLVGALDGAQRSRRTGAVPQSRSRLQHHPPQLRGITGPPRVGKYRRGRAHRQRSGDTRSG